MLCNSELASLVGHLCWTDAEEGWTALLRPVPVACWGINLKTLEILPFPVPFFFISFNADQTGVLVITMGAMTHTSGGFDQFLDQFKTQTAGHVKQLTVRLRLTLLFALRTNLCADKKNLRQTLALQFSELVRQYDDVRRDLESERLARRHSQENAEVLASRVKDLEESIVSTFEKVLKID